MSEETKFPSAAAVATTRQDERQADQQGQSSSAISTGPTNTQPLTKTGYSKPQTTKNIEMLIEKAKEGPKLIFPMQLHKLLRLSGEYGAHDIVSWFPNGKAFRVHNRRKFESMIMKRFFNQSVYRSFLRQLNGWGFTRVINGDEVMEGAYQHPLFLRDQPDLCRRMIRAKVTPSGSAKKKKAATASSASSKDSVASHGSASISSDQSNPLLQYQQQLLGNKQRRMIDNATALNSYPGMCRFFVSSRLTSSSS